MTNSMPDQWNFGVGCLAFEYHDAPAEFSVEEWEAAVRQSLESIPSIEGINVAAYEPEEIWSVPAVDPNAEEEIGYEKHFIPHPTAAIIQFDITIPERFQESTIGPNRRLNVGEKFRVNIEYAYESPVAYVLCLDDTRSPSMNGAEAVVLVRKFLADALRRSDQPIRLSVLGPSPFHGTFHVVSSDIDKQWQWQQVSREGYATFELEYSPDQFEDSDDAWASLRSMLSTELSVFYEIQRRRDRRLHDSVKISAKTRRLIEASKASGVKAWFGRTFGTSAMARDLGIASLEASLAADDDNEWAREQVEELELQTHVLGIAKTEIRRTANESFSGTYKSGLSMVKFLEGGRTKEFEVAIVASSTLLGAIAGLAAALVVGA